MLPLFWNLVAILAWLNTSQTTEDGRCAIENLLGCKFKRSEPSFKLYKNLIVFT